jgi:hypothetical protein
VSLGPQDLLWNAKIDLANQLQTDTACRAAVQQYVYNVLKVGGHLGFFKHSIINENFTSYIRNTRYSYDGTKSTLDSKQLVFRGIRYYGRDGNAELPTPNFLATSDATKTPQNVGIAPTASGMNLLNESNLFHEALHGYIGKGDLYIQQLLTTIDPAVIAGGPSDNISVYIRKWVLSACPISRR